MISRALILTSFAALLTIATANDASAGVCDLTTNGASCGPAVFTNFAIFGEVSPQPTGSGYIDPFLRLLASPREQGYNTSAPFQQDQKKPGTFTHDLLLSAVPLKTIDGVQYREFFLDINETKNHELLSLDELRIYLSTSGERDSVRREYENARRLDRHIRFGRRQRQLDQAELQPQSRQWFRGYGRVHSEQPVHGRQHAVRLPVLAIR